LGLACSSSGDDRPVNTGGSSVLPTLAANAASDAPAVPSATSEAAPGGTATVPVPEVSPVTGRAEPNGDRILEAVRTLSVTLGPRVAGMESEKQAAAVIAGWLEELGYEVRLQEFPIGREIARSSRMPGCPGTFRQRPGARSC
jgi:hypothetical protein